MPVVEKVTQLIKSEANAFSGIWQSKKFSITFLWATTCAFYADHWLEENPRSAEIALICATAAICVFIAFQTLLEIKGVGQVVPNGPSIDPPK